MGLNFNAKGEDKWDQVFNASSGAQQQAKSGTEQKAPQQHGKSLRNILLKYRALAKGPQNSKEVTRRP